MRWAGVVLAIAAFATDGARAQGTYVISTLAGRSAAGAADGSGPDARFLQPYGVAVDGTGTVYVADTVNATIRKITPDGTVTTFAGVAGSKATTDGTGSAARFISPTGIAIDAAGTLYVTDSSTVRKITPAGTVTTIAGRDFGSVDGPGSIARFASPTGIAVDSAGILFVSDTYNHTIRKITTSGTVSTLAGLSRAQGFADGAGGTARFNWPAGIAVDAQDRVYVADAENHAIRQVSPDGLVTTIAGTPFVFAATDGSLSVARFGEPSGIAVDGAGTLYVADISFNNVRKISAGMVTTLVAGTAGLGQPQGVAVDTGGTVYVADTTNGVIRRISASGAMTALAGFADSAGVVDAAGGDARFNHPQDVVAGDDGTLYVADTVNNVIRAITPAGVVRTLATADFHSPGGVAVDGSGTVYIADTLNNTIRTVTPDGFVSTLAGLAGSRGSADGIGSAARFNQPSRLTVDPLGTVYVADTGNHTIRAITPGGIVTTLAGAPGVFGLVDGQGAAARFNNPMGLAVGPDGVIYVADSSNNAIRSVTRDGSVITLAGGTLGAMDGVGRSAQFNSPRGIAVLPTGTLHVADTANDTIRAIDSTGRVTTVAGAAVQTGSGDGTGGNARFFNPTGLTASGIDRLYVADTLNNTIRTATIRGALSPTVTVTGGSVVYDASAHDVSATATGFHGSPVAGSSVFAYAPGGPASPVNVGTYIATASFHSADPAYADATGTGVISIIGATPTLSAAAAVFSYDGAPHPIVATATGIHGVPVAGTMTAVYAPGGTSAPVAPGTYAARIYFASSDPNYVDAAVMSTVTITPPAYATQVAALGPSGYWQMGEAGGDLADSSGHVITGSRQGSPTYGATGRFANGATAIQFNGSSYFTFGDNFGFAGTTSFSFAFWMYRTAVPATTYEHVLSKQSDGAFNGWFVSLFPLSDPSAGRLSFQRNVGGTNVAVNSTSPLPLNQWNLIVGTYDGARMRLYVNGVAQGAGTPTTLSLGTSANPFTIGKSAQFNASFFSGRLQDVAVIQGRALSQTDVTGFYAARPEGTTTITIPPSAAYAGQVLASSPSGYWQMGEGSGDLGDSSGNAIVGTGHGSPTYGIAGPYDDGTTSIRFNGANSYFTFGNNFGFAGTTAFSFAFWMYQTAVPATVYEQVLSKQSDGSFNGWFVSLFPQSDPSRGRLSFQRNVGGTSVTVNTVGPLPLNHWNLIVGTYDGARMHLYVNGIEQGTGTPSTLSLANSTNPFTIGKSAQFNASFFTGQLRDVAIFSGRALSQADVTAYYAPFCPPLSAYARKVTALTPSGYWQMGDTGGDLADSSGNAVTGASHGSPTYGVPGPANDGTTAIQFNGTNSSFTLGNNFGFPGTTAFSFSFWMYRTTVPATVYEHVLSKQLDATFSGWFVSVFPMSDPSAGRLSFQRSAGGSTVTVNTTDPLPLNQWNSVIGTYDGTRMRLFVNGAEQGTGTATTLPLATGTNPFTIGKSAQYNASYFTGRLKDVVIVPGRALSQVEVTALSVRDAQ